MTSGIQHLPVKGNNRQRLTATAGSLSAAVH